MKNKRLLALFIVLVIIVTLVILGSTVFTVKKITVVFNEDREKTQVYEGAENDIINNIKGELLGKSVFTLTDSAIREMIDDPYIDLIRSVVAYPNRVTLHLVERKEMFAVEYEGRFFMTDRYGFVLAERETNTGNKVDEIIYDIPDGKNILVSGADLDEPPVVGQRINLSEDKLNALIAVATNFYENPNRDPTIDLTWQIRVQYLRSIEFVGYDMKIETERNHLDQFSHTIILKNFVVDAKEKMSLAWTIHEYGDNLRKKGTITVTVEDEEYSAVISDTEGDVWDKP